MSEAAGGEAALALLRTSADPFVVLLDHLMPRMSGADVLRMAIRAGLVQRHAFVLLAAAPLLLDPELEAQAQAKALGIPVVTKPFHLDMLLVIVAGCAAHLDAAEHAAAR